MQKKIATLFIAIIFALAAFPNGQQAEAATTYTFVKANYTETLDKNGEIIERTVKSVTVKNSANKTATFTIDNTAHLYINNTSTNISGFKPGMSVTISTSQKKIREMRSNTNNGDGSIVANSKQLVGAVIEIDPNGLYIQVKQEGAGTRTYFVNNNTEVFKSNSSVDLSALYVGDRVRLKFATANTRTISELTIMTSSAALVQDLYKGSLSAINTSKNTITVKNAHPFMNWQFGISATTAQKTFTMTDKTSIYLGNQKISKAKLKNYRNNEMYFVTTKQFSKEVINKIVVLKNNEFTFYQPITSVNSNVNRIVLSNNRNLEYHSGSILIRNGRLIEPEGLVALNPAATPIQTSAFVITDGTTNAKYAHVVNVTNDNLNSPNLSGHQLYFGLVDLADMDAYKVELANMEVFNNNVWTNYNEETVFAYSNSTIASEIDGVKVYPEMELEFYEGEYAYFYVKNGHIQAMHFVGDNVRTRATATGRVNSISSSSITVKDASQWLESGHWTYLGQTTVDLEKVMVIKNGKVIEVNQLDKNDRVVLLMNENLETHIILVNE